MTTLDPTYELTRKPRVPMSPEQLDALRPKPVVATSQPSTAKQMAYETGIRALEPLVLRIEALEATVRELTARLEQVQ